MEPPSKRKRSVVSCTECHRRKQKVHTSALDSRILAANLHHTVRPPAALSTLHKERDTSKFFAFIEFNALIMLDPMLL